MRYHRLEHRFVEEFPEPLEPGILYVSIEYGSVAHSCCCGCGEEIVTPLTPTDWNIVYDGEAISLHPSVGSWTLPCRSHYVIRKNKVIEAPPWSDKQVQAERKRDRSAKARFYDTEPSPQVMPQAQIPEAAVGVPVAEVVLKPNWLRRVVGWIGRNGK